MTWFQDRVTHRDLQEAEDFQFALATAATVLVRHPLKKPENCGRSITAKWSLGRMEAIMTLVQEKKIPLH